MTTRVRVFESKVDEVVGPMIERAVNAGVESARRLVPVDTGELQGGIEVKELEKTRGTYGVDDVEHAQHVEFGTFKMAAQPYLRPSVDAVRQAVGR